MTLTLRLHSLVVSVASRLLSALPACVRRELESLRQLNTFRREMNAAREMYGRHYDVMFGLGERMGIAYEAGYFRNLLCRLAFIVLCHRGLHNIMSDWAEGYRAGVSHEIHEKQQDEADEYFY